MRETSEPQLAAGGGQTAAPLAGLWPSSNGPECFNELPLINAKFLVCSWWYQAALLGLVFDNLHT